MLPVGTAVVLRVKVWADATAERHGTASATIESFVPKEGLDMMGPHRARVLGSTCGGSGRPRSEDSGFLNVADRCSAAGSAAKYTRCSEFDERSHSFRVGPECKDPVSG